MRKKTWERKEIVTHAGHHLDQDVGNGSFCDTLHAINSHVTCPCGCYASRQIYVEVNDTYSEGGTHEETLRSHSKARVMNKRRGD